MLFREGDPADTLLRDPPAAASRSRSTCRPRRARRSRRSSDGEVLGWSWLFPPYRWHFDARALEPVRAIAFDGACLRGKCEADHELGYELMQRFAQVLIERLRRRGSSCSTSMAARPRLSAAAAATRCCPRPFRVVARRRETARHLHARRSSPPAASRSRSRPGQFNMLYAFGVGEVPISISGDPAQPTELVHTVRAVGAVTARDLRRRSRATCSASAGRSATPGRRRGRGRRRRDRRRRHRARAAARRVPTTCSRDRDRYGRGRAALRRAHAGRHAVTRRELERWRERGDVDVEVTVDSADARLAGQRRRGARRCSARATFEPANAVALRRAGPRS